MCPKTISSDPKTHQWRYTDVKPKEWMFAIEQLRPHSSGTVLSHTCDDLTQLHHYKTPFHVSFTVTQNYRVTIDKNNGNKRVFTCLNQPPKPISRNERQYLIETFFSSDQDTIINQYKPKHVLMPDGTNLEHSFITFNGTIYALGDVMGVGSYGSVFYGMSQNQTFLAFKMLHPWKTPRMNEYSIGVKAGFFIPVSMQNSDTANAGPPKVPALRCSQSAPTDAELPVRDTVTAGDTSSQASAQPRDLEASAGVCPAEAFSLKTTYVSQYYAMNLDTFCKKLPTLVVDMQKRSLIFLDIWLRSCNQLARLHRLNILHLDIKPDNILINFTRSIPGAWSELTVDEIAIADFGLSAEMSSGEMSVDGRPCGTPEYMAPEIISACKKKKREEQNVRFTRACDIYSLGVTFLQLHTHSKVQFDNVDVENNLQFLRMHMKSENPAFRLHLCYVEFILINMLMMLKQSTDCAITISAGTQFLYFLFDHHARESLALSDDFWFRWTEGNQNDSDGLEALQTFLCENNTTLRVLRLYALYQRYGTDSALFAKELKTEQCGITTAVGAEFLLWLIEQAIFLGISDHRELVHFVFFLQQAKQEPEQQEAQYWFLHTKLSELRDPANTDSFKTQKKEILCDIVRTKSWMSDQRILDLYTPFVASSLLFNSDNQDGLLDLLSSYFKALLVLDQNGTTTRMNRYTFLAPFNQQEKITQRQALEGFKIQIAQRIALLSTPEAESALRVANAW